MEKRETLLSLKVYTFEEDTKLCVVATLEEYLKRTNIRCGNDKSKLSLGFVKPQNPEVSSTSEWVKNIFSEAGIDNEIFKRHSTHSASASKAGFGGTFCDRHFRKRFLE